MAGARSEVSLPYYYIKKNKTVNLESRKDSPSPFPHAPLTESSISPSQQKGATLFI